MPVTRSELLFLAGGAIAGAAAAKNFDRLKEKVGPWVATAGDAFGDAYSAAARRVGEKVESIQDAMAEMRQAPAAGDASATTS
ncbi:MAG: hypothetical protein P4L84_37525 [Isosphaeraceae bacterium]|nr:hypothetical protein [Isosphaeraceae bacterium]